MFFVRLERVKAHPKEAESKTSSDVVGVDGGGEQQLVKEKPISNGLQKAPDIDE